MSSKKPATKLPEGLIEKAKYLRKVQTSAEKKFWEVVRDRRVQGLKIRRQHPIKQGIILDFYCHSAKIAIEIDGGYHKRKEVALADRERTEILKGLGIRTIRFTNEEVLEYPEKVIDKLKQEMFI